MPSNLDRYRKDLNTLLQRGRRLALSLAVQWLPEFREAYRKQHGDDALKNLPSFNADYQTRYSEAKLLIRQLLPDRLDDFVRHYEKPKSRKELTNETYRIDDCLQGISVTQVGETLTSPSAAIPHFEQQLAILQSVKARFESSLFDIRQLVQADLFDSELDAAKELAKNKFTRAAGALAGEVLERHLAEICVNHGVKVSPVWATSTRR